jgi:hypothetical protein
MYTHTHTYSLFEREFKFERFAKYKLFDKVSAKNFCNWSKNVVCNFRQNCSPTLFIHKTIYILTTHKVLYMSYLYFYRFPPFHILFRHILIWKINLVHVEQICWLSSDRLTTQSKIISWNAARKMCRKSAGIAHWTVQKTPGSAQGSFGSKVKIHKNFQTRQT